MSLIDDALRQLDPADPKPSMTQIPPPPAPPQRRAAPPSSTPVVETAPPITVGPWVGFLATAGGSAILLVLGLVLGAFWNTQFSRRGPSKSKPAAAAPANMSVVTVQSPDRPRGSRRLPRLELNGIISGVGEPFAIVNGRLVRLGEVIEGATLVELQDSLARFRWADDELIVRIAN